MGLSSANLAHTSYVCWFDDAIDTVWMEGLVPVPGSKGQDDEPVNVKRVHLYMWTRDPQYLRLLPGKAPCTWRLRRLTATQLAEVHAESAESRQDLLAFRLAVRGADNLTIYDGATERALEIKHERVGNEERVADGTVNALPALVWRDVGKAAVVLSSLTVPFQRTSPQPPTCT